jgi:hypothetical protein
MEDRKAAYRVLVRKHERNYLEDPGIDGWVILKYIPQNVLQKMQGFIN